MQLWASIIVSRALLVRPASDFSLEYLDTLRLMVYLLNLHH